MNKIFRPITLALLYAARFTSNTSAAKYYINTAIEYEDKVL